MQTARKPHCCKASTSPALQTLNSELGAGSPSPCCGSGTRAGTVWRGRPRDRPLLPCSCSEATQAPQQPHALCVCHQSGRLAELYRAVHPVPLQWGGVISPSHGRLPFLGEPALVSSSRPSGPLPIVARPSLCPVHTLQGLNGGKPGISPPLVWGATQLAEAGSEVAQLSAAGDEYAFVRRISPRSRLCQAG